jgi:TonB-dependent receptor
MTRSVQVSIAAALIGAVTATTSYAQQQNTSETVEEVVVTGFRASLQSSTEAKRQSVGFVDAIFSEDIGKFPDTNLAESFNRIPGVNISRDITGEGLQVAIRGLNTNFTRVLLNGAPVAIASTGQDNAAQNREVDLDLFPSELFSQLTVAKTTSADMLEGGAAGTINMRMARPFDREGMNLTYQIQGIDNANADSRGARGSLLFSNTWGNFGALAGVAGVQNKVATTGFETIGWTSMNLTQDQCGGNNPMGQPLPCNTTGGAGAGPGQITTIPANPSTAAAGFTPNDPVTNAFLLAQNPGRSITEIDNAIFPRLGRPMFDVGDKDRHNAIVSFEFRPSDALHFYMDNMYGKKENDLERADLMWAVRRTSQGGLVIPQNLQVDNPGCVPTCVVTSGTFVNSQLMLEYRPYFEETEFWGSNPGMTWTINDKWSLDLQGNYTESDFYSEVPTVLVLTQPTTVTYTNDGSGNPVINSSLDLNDPANYTWLIENRNGGSETGRVDLTAQKRKTETAGGRFALTWGDTDLNLKFGASYDDVSRDIRPLNNTQQLQNAVCGGNPTSFVAAPNTQPPCRGLSASEIAAVNAAALAANPTGAPPFPVYNTYQGSLIPNSAVPGYLRPTEYGFVTVDWASFARDSNYDAILAQMGEGGSTPTTANWGTIAEEVTGAFFQVNGDTEIAQNRFRYNIGLRYVQTDQTVISRLTAQDTRNVVPGGGGALIADGTRFPDVVNLVELDTDYSNTLPSANVVWNVSDNFLVRGGWSKTMTRANPADMLLGLSIPNADVSSVNLGNPELDPYLSKNFDLGFEYYTGQEGYFGVAAFRKALEGFTTRQATIVTFGDLAEFGVTLESLGQGQRDAVNGRGGNAALVTLNQTVNASGQLTINGLEFTWVQPLDFALERFGLGGLGFAANYTIIDQKGEGVAPAIAIGVPPETYNATLYYERHGISARVSVTSAQGSQGTGPNSNQSQITGAELFGEDYTQWDFSSSFDFAEMFGWSDFAPQLTIDVINLDDAVRRTYFQVPDATFTEFNSGRTVMVGLRGRF